MPDLGVGPTGAFVTSLLFVVVSNQPFKELRLSRRVLGFLWPYGSMEMGSGGGKWSREGNALGSGKMVSVGWKWSREGGNGLGAAGLVKILLIRMIC